MSHVYFSARQKTKIDLNRMLKKNNNKHLEEPCTEATTMMMMILELLLGLIGPLMSVACDSPVHYTASYYRPVVIGGQD